MMVKICGITNREDALAAVEAGASAIGLNFYRESPRYVSPTGAAMITRKLPSDVLKVGVFVDELPDVITKIALQANLDVVQLHGISECSSLHTWRAVAVGEALEPLEFNISDPDAFLLDTASVLSRGGSGRTFCWSLAKEAAQHTTKRIIIAGGLDACNVQQAIDEAQPWGVDVCSRIETEPGRKDHTKMRQFIQAALAAKS